MENPKVVITGYCLQLDRATVELLKGGKIAWPSTVIPGVLTDSGLEYAVKYIQDNEYVHKAMHRALREAIKIAKAAVQAA